MQRRLMTITALALLTTSAACLDLDGFVYNGVHCSNVSEETCEGTPYKQWDKVCLSCDEPYDWEQDYDWWADTPAFPDGAAHPRPIDPATVVNRRLETEDGEATLDVYYIPAHGDDADRAQITLIYNHGNYAGLEHYLPRVRFLHEAGFNILTWDYRGYGKSEPAQHPTTQQFLADARQLRELAREYAPDPERVVIYGMSLGAIPSVEMALHEQPCAMLLEVPFTSMSQVARSNSGVDMPGGFLSQGYFENTLKVEDYPGPLFVMHGTEDDAFPLEDVRELYEAAPGPKELWVVDGASHGMGVGVAETATLAGYIEGIDTFLTAHAPGCLP